MYEVLGYLESLAGKDPQRFIYASLPHILKHCAKGLRADGQHYNIHHLNKVFAELRARHIVSCYFLTWDKRYGFVFEPHDLRCRPSGGYCIMRTPKRFECSPEAEEFYRQQPAGRRILVPDVSSAGAGGEQGVSSAGAEGEQCGEQSAGQYGEQCSIFASDATTSVAESANHDGIADGNASGCIRFSRFSRMNRMSRTEPTKSHSENEFTQGNEQQQHQEQEQPQKQEQARLGFSTPKPENRKTESQQQRRKPVLSQEDYYRKDLPKLDPPEPQLIKAMWDDHKVVPDMDDTGHWTGTWKKQ
jgi:hypothetical protein